MTIDHTCHEVWQLKTPKLLNQQRQKPAL